MAKKTAAPAPPPARDPGLTIRVPLETLRKLRSRVATLPRSPLLSEAEMVSRLAVRALEIGAESAELVPRG